MNRFRAEIIFLLSLAASGGAYGADAFGPVIWSEDGLRAYTWHDERIVELDLLEGGLTPLTDSIPVPHAIGVDEGNRSVVVSSPSAEPRAVLYSIDSGESILCYTMTGRRTLLSLSCYDGLVTAVGVGYAVRFDLLTGEREPPIDWVGRARPIDISFERDRAVVLQQDRIVEYGHTLRESSFESDGLRRALFTGPYGWSVLEQRENDLVLIFQGGEERSAGTLAPDERFSGAQYSPAGEKLLVVIEMPGVTEGNRTTRLEIRDGKNGERIQFLRSAQRIRGADHFESPLAAAIHPNGQWLIVNWPLTGIQLWEMGEEWALLHSW